jgi:hypothetical protein
MQHSAQSTTADAHNVRKPSPQQPAPAVPLPRHLFKSLPVLSLCEPGYRAGGGSRLVSLRCRAGGSVRRMQRSPMRHSIELPSRGSTVEANLPGLVSTFCHCTAYAVRVHGPAPALCVSPRRSRHVSYHPADSVTSDRSTLMSSGGTLLDQPPGYFADTSLDHSGKCEGWLTG